MVDSINPNAYSNETKTAWINECEGLVQTKALLLPPEELRQYRYSARWTGIGVTFPNDHTMLLPSDHGFKAGDSVTILGLSLYDGNIKTTPVPVTAVEDRALIFAEDSFDDIGTTPETASATVFFDGSGTVLLAPPPYDKLYYPYVSAMVDFANGEYSRYANEMAMFNARFRELTAWTAGLYDAHRERG